MILCSGAQPCRVRLFTWEYAATFDEKIPQDELERAFEREFPKVSSSVRTGKCICRIWPLVTFNAPEGRLSRYLVALSSDIENLKAKHRGRCLPWQIWIYAAADRAMRGAAEEHGGNFWCHIVVEGTLFILVFYEGRLCHWSEESGYPEGFSESDKLELRLRRFRQFLKKDPLFSRVDSFMESRLEAAFDRRLFLSASRDPFWRRLDFMRSTKRQNGFSFRPKGKFIVGLMLLLASVLGIQWQDDELVCKDCRESLPVELSPYPEFQMAEYMEESLIPSADDFGAHRHGRLPCVLPDFRLNGLVEYRIAIVSLGSAETTLPLREGDSIGSFALTRVGRDRIVLVCGDSTVERGVGDGAR